MPTHRIAFHFVDETPDDRAFWQEWLEGLDPALRAVAMLGERRPSIQIAAPFDHRHPNQTSRTDEQTGLDHARTLVAALRSVATARGRPVSLLFSGQPLGTISVAGTDAAVATKLAAWESLVEARPADEPRWERDDVVSIWAGMLPKRDYEHLMDESYEDDEPISPFARDLGITFYDHDFVESSHTDAPRRLCEALKGHSYAASFVEQLPATASDQLVDTVILMFDADFSRHAKTVARGRLRFIAVLPYSK